MKKEVLFRGKSIEKETLGRWVEGNLVLDETGVWIVSGVIKATDEEFILSHRCQIHPRTIGEYTNWRDKNGKRIFSGDVLRKISDRSTLNVLGTDWRDLVVLTLKDGKIFTMEGEHLDMYEVVDTIYSQEIFKDYEF